jgi:flagellar motor switch protein FliN/FliY
MTENDQTEQAEPAAEATSAAAEATSAAAEGAAPAAEAPAGPGALDFVLDVPLRVTVEVGGARMHVREVLQLVKGSVVELDRASGEPADVMVNGRLVARGELTVVDERLAVRIVEVVGANRLGH